MLKRAAVVFGMVGLMAGAAYASQVAGTGINGSFHDINSMSASYQPDKFLRSCVFCHTPHNAKTGAVGGTDAPLWNHVANQPLTSQPYNWIAPANQQAGVDINTSDPLVGPSRLCMACHDGNTAVDSHGTAGFTTTAGTKMTSAYPDPVLGGTAKRYIADLTVTHPIGFQYEAMVTARPGEIVSSTDGRFITGNSSAILTGGGASSFNTKARPAALTTGGKLIKETLYGGYMTCASCHEVHNTKNAVPDTPLAYNYYLWAKEEGFVICLFCHIK
jgi:cytochrome c553